MQALLLPREAAEHIGVSIATVKTWMRRAEHPLPNVVVGKSGRNLKVIAAEIEPWLTAEATRKASANGRGGK